MSGASYLTTFSRRGWYLLCAACITAGALAEESRGDFRSAIFVDTLSDAVDGDTSSVLALLGNRGADGLLSLAEAIHATNVTEWPYEILFSVEGEIALAAPLPALNNAAFGVAIEGGDKIVLKGEALTTMEIGLSIHSAGNTIRGLAFRDFEGVAVCISGESAFDNVIASCSFGNGEFHRTEDSIGILVTNNAHRNLIGGLEEVALNHIGEFGWLKCGIVLSAGAKENDVRGNIIGSTGNDSRDDIGNFYAISILAGAYGNTIGGTDISARNVIAGNVSGIRIGGSSENVVQGNYIGIDPSGQERVWNTIGISLSDGANRNIIGGSTAGARNVLTNVSKDISIHASYENVIQGNYFSTDAAGSQSFFDLGAIEMSAGSARNIVGGSAPGEGNVIYGCTYDSIRIRGAGTAENVIVGNLIGTGYTAMDAHGNPLGPSIWISEGACCNRIGGASAGAGNVLAGNDQWGIRISHVGSDGNLIQGNFIGVDGAGTAVLSNASGGILVQSGAQNVIGGAGAGEGNHIAYNGGPGVTVQFASALGTTILGNSIHDNEGEGIVLKDDANDNISFPKFWSLEPLEGTAPPGALIQLFVDGNIQGRSYILSIRASEAGWFSIGGLRDAYPGMNITVTATDIEGNTSEFGSLAHRADGNADHMIELDELLRLIQLFNSLTIHCDESTEDGYAAGTGDRECEPHTSDYAPSDWHISLLELLRAIQLFNVGGYVPCPDLDTEDGFCPGRIAEQ